MKLTLKLVPSKSPYLRGVMGIARLSASLHTQPLQLHYPEPFLLTEPGRPQGSPLLYDGSARLRASPLFMWNGRFGAQPQTAHSTYHTHPFTFSEISRKLHKEYVG